MKKRKLKKALWWILPTVAVIVIASILALPSVKYALQGRVTTFDFRRKGYTVPPPKEWRPDYYGPFFIDDIEESIRSCGLRDGEIIPMPSEPLTKTYTYGAILVVTPLYSENTLVYSHGDTHRVLTPDKTWPEHSVKKLQRGSAVLTTVRIEEVLYQTAATDYKPGDTVQIRELYFVLDKRVPDAYEEYVQKHGTPVVTYDIGWHPMETGETYLVYGEVNFCPEKYEIWDKTIATHYNEMYCLSDPAKPTGAILSEERYAEGMAYIRKEYNLTRYEKK